MHLMNIGQAARAAGVTPKMVRHYESLGLIPAPDRTDAGYRLYGEREVARLRFIRQARGLGFSMKQIEALLALWQDDGRQSREVKDLALAQLEDLAQRQRELDEMKAVLTQLVADCAGDHQAHCAILETLALDAVPSPATPAAPSRALKQVRAGSRRPASKRQPGPATRAGSLAEPAHAGLMAWTRGIAAAPTR